MPQPPAAALDRDRLFTRLSEHQTVVVGATAGYGKSVLLSSWLAHAAGTDARAWITLDPSAADPTRLVSDLLAALRAAAGDTLSAALESLRAPQLFADPHSLVDSLHEALWDTELPLTLVVDDVQMVGGSEAALAVLDHFLMFAPSSTRIVLAGRSMLGLRLQRLRLEDRLGVLSHSDLAFTLDETIAVLDRAGATIDREAAAALHAVTQGWPAGVRLAALALGSGAAPDPARLLPRDDALADYLTTEVLASLAPELRSFVLDATIDELVSPDLVDAVRGSSDGYSLLERCLADGLFLMRDDKEGWYRWHALFAAHMRARRSVDDPARTRALELEAALWWRDGDPARAVAHAGAAGEAELAGEIVADAWLPLVLAGQSDTVVTLVSSVYSDVACAAELHLALALVASQRGDVATARTELAAARHDAPRLEQARRARFDILSTVIELFVVNDRSALEAAVMSGRTLLLDVEQGSWTPDVATSVFVRLCVGMGEARLQDDVPSALRLLRTAAASARDSGLVALELAAEAELTIPAIAEDDLEANRLMAEGVLESARAMGWGDLPSLAAAYGFLGWYHLWRGDPRRGREQLERSLATMLPTDWGLRGLATNVHAQACLSTGDIEAAAAGSREAHRLAESGQMPPWWPSLQTSFDAHLLLAQGRPDEALRLAREQAPGPQYFLALCYQASVLHACGHPQEALAVLEDYPTDRMFAHVGAMVWGLRASSYAATGRLEEAHEALERALAVAEPSLFSEPFALVGTPVLPLLLDHLRRGTAYPEFVVRVQRRLEAPAQLPVNESGEGLTDRERKILRYLATNLSNSEISKAEFVSVNTVKTHIAHVYRKLGVNSRREAVHRASELGLL